MDTITGMEQLVAARFAQWQIDNSRGDFAAAGLFQYREIVKTCFPGTETSYKPTGDTAVTFQPKDGLLKSLVGHADQSIHAPDGTTISHNVATQLRRLDAPTRSAPLDTAWVNMVVESSYWSNKLRKGMDVDSVQVEQYQARNANRFKTDKYYQLAMLEFLQRGDDYKAYYAQLLNTPNDVIAGTHHVHNKLQDVYEQNADSAYALVSLLHQRDARGLKGWVQHSFAQAFIPERERNRTEEHKLLAMMQADPLFAPYVLSLGYWVKVMEHAGDTLTLNRVAGELMAADSTEWQCGNPGRYGMLVYGILREAGMHAQADRLLAYTINRLENEMQRLEDESKYLTQHLLGHAYYLAYQQAVDRDPDRALEVLARAASCSPKNQGERAHGSFYDAVFLKSQPSYEVVYMQALAKAGRGDEARRALANAFLATPENIASIQKLFEESFTDTDFATFFREDVVGTWPDAPTFAVTDLSNEVIELQRYAKKWLVLDFWGTWCGPCVSEMPELDAYYREHIAAGKLGDVALLAIACYDTQKKVSDFMTNTGYAIPVALSDGNVQQAYGITGYPTKVVVSPTGKMLAFRFGADWKAALAKFVELHPGG